MLLLHLNSLLTLFVCCQDKLVLRVQTANDEVAHLKDFDYGKVLQPLMNCRHMTPILPNLLTMHEDQCGLAIPRNFVSFEKV